jgi:hypothetical protein
LKNAEIVGNVLHGIRAAELPDIESRVTTLFKGLLVSM